jgi:DNA replication and repair protein RecF
MSWNADEEVIPHTQIDGHFVRGQQEHVIAVTLVKEPVINGDAAKTVFRRQITLDGMPRRAMDILGQINVVLFLPEDIQLVSGGPAERRRYLDVTLCQIDPAYCRNLARYNRVVTQRNALLRQVRERQARSDELAYWDEQLATLGAAVLSRRLWALAELTGDANATQRELTGDREALGLIYQSTAHERLALSIETPPALTDVEAWQALLQRAYRAARVEEIARAVTVLGPHRDDVRFLINGIDATVYGSRGQQRTVALALKLAEVRLMHRQTGEMPLLLLDDVLSELDRRRCHLLLGAVAQAEQVLITTTDLNYFEPGFLAGAQLWQVTAGTVAPV